MVAAMMPSRFMGARVPLPEPKWKQQDNIEGTIATNMDSATGLERAEMLAEMEGRNIFDDAVIIFWRTQARSAARCVRIVWPCTTFQVLCCQPCAAVPFPRERISAAARQCRWPCNIDDIDLNFRLSAPGRRPPWYM